MINLPEEFLKDMQALLDEKDYYSFLETYNEKPRKGLRLNSLKKVSKDDLPFNLSSVPWCNNGYYYAEEDFPGKSVLHAAGLYYIQEPSAMSVCEALDVNEGDVVLDLCAAPGGKSTQIASKLNDTGLLISNEIDPQRSQILASNIERMGVKNCIVLNEAPGKLTSKFKLFFDKILVDAPCSGQGMFRKDNNAIDEWSKDIVTLCQKRQLEILEDAQKMLKPGGRLVYSTCTFAHEENEDVIDEFLNNHKEFSLVESSYKFHDGLTKFSKYENQELYKTQRLFPHKIEGEGHFFAILKKDGELTKTEFNLKPLKKIKEYEEFIKSTLNVYIEPTLAFGNYIYSCKFTNLAGLKVVRAGLCLGELKKGRFEPSHSLALALKKDDFKNTVDFSHDDKDLFMYVCGESINVSNRGWGVVLVNGHPIGWYKGDGSLGKNHYPKGLRTIFQIRRR